MKRIFFIIIFAALETSVKAQVFSGMVFTRDNSSLYLNQIFVTNLTTNKTVLCSFTGAFIIGAVQGDIVRFTSIATERFDVKITEKHLSNLNNLIELPLAYQKIEEVVIFKPSGILKKDLMRMPKTQSEKKQEIIAMLGLPAPAKSDTIQMAKPIIPNPFALDVQSLYDVLSGDRRRRTNLYRYEIMARNVQMVRNYFGDEYFEKFNIPKNLIDNFLQFVYTSEKIDGFVQSNNFEAVKIFIEKYLPIFQKRLQDSKLQKEVVEK